jgi:hypothetical protein
MTKIVLFAVIMLLNVFVANAAAAPQTIIFGDAQATATESVELTLEDPKGFFIFIEDFPVTAGDTGALKAASFANRIDTGPASAFLRVLSLTGASVTVDTFSRFSPLVRSLVHDNSIERHILSTPAESDATGTIAFVGDLSCVDSRGGPAIFRAGFFSPLLGGASTPAFTCDDVMTFTGNPPTGAGVAQLVGAFFATVLRPANLQVVGNTIKIGFPAIPFGSHSIDAQRTDSTVRAEVSLEINRQASVGVPPTTTATPSPAPNALGWNKTNVTISLSAVDNSGGSGVKAINFSLSGAQGGGGVVAGSNAAVTISAEGTTILTYFATDNAGNREAPKTLTVRIDKTPPVISGLPAAGCTLWPANHQMVQVAMVTASDELSGLAPGSLIVTAISSEAALQVGSGRTAADIVITGTSVQLRAERAGAGSGRVYTISASASDIAGNSATATAICTVPHDQRK